MKRLRLVLLVVLTLALPSLGLAAAGTPSRCDMMAMSSAAEMSTMPMMDCSSVGQGDLDGKFKSHGGCKMDAACKTFGADQFWTAPLALSSLSAARVDLPVPATPALAHNPDGLWRPPQPV